MGKRLDILVDSFGRHNCMGEYGCVASFDAEQWRYIEKAVATELLARVSEEEILGELERMADEG